MSALYGLGAAGMGLPQKPLPVSASHSRRAKYKKAPGAPKRFKSAFIFFSTEKHKEIRAEMGEKGTAEKTTNVAKLVSEAWRNLDAKEREKWEEMAKKDRARYEEERKNYRGPWKVAVSKKPYKDPNAPKRPMSAFLMYSNGRRAAVKKEHPEFSNGEISRLLSEMWRAAPDEERQKYIKEEFELRQKYKVDIAKWRKEAEEKEKERIAKEEEEERNAPPHRDDMSRIQSSLFAGAGAGALGGQQAYLAALGLGGGGLGGAAGYEELAMQRARSQLEAEQRARLISQLGGGGGASGLDAAADPYARLAAAAAFGQYPESLLGAGADAYSQAAVAGQLRQQHELLLQEQERAAAAMSAYGQQSPYNYTESQAAQAQAVLDAYQNAQRGSAGAPSGAYEQGLADAAAYAQQNSLESQLGGGGYGGAASSYLGRGASGFGRSP